MSNQFSRYKDKICRVFANSGNGKTFVYNGLIIDIDDDFLTMDDQKLGKTTLSIADIKQISEGIDEKTNFNAA
jgi:hypothetical protein|tara:strand:- start:1404 stop:1622 length:219 start_codon:yes stop_codon:yes gene_type:complete